MRTFPIFLLSAALSAQTFDVASVKLSTGSRRGSQGGPGSSDPGRYRFTSATLLDLVAIAHNVEYFQVSSKTSLDRDRYDVIANLPEGATKEQFRVMMQNLLAERFHLQSHKESREFPAFELVVAKSGSKLGKQPPVEGFPDLPPGKPGMQAVNSMQNGHILVRMRARQMPMAEAIRFFRPPGENPVVDRTGLSDRYDFTLEYGYPARGAQEISDAPPAPTIFTAVQQQLGLQLIPKRLPFDVIVVDSFERVPAEN